MYDITEKQMQSSIMSEDVKIACHIICYLLTLRGHLSGLMSTS